MSEGPQPTNKPPRPPQPDRFQPKLLIFWVLLVAVILLLFSYPQQNPNVVPMNMTEVVQAAEQGRIQKLFLKPEPGRGNNWYEVWGELKPPAAPAEAAADAAKSTIPAAPQDKGAEAAAAKAAAPKPVSFRAEGRLTDERFNQLTTLDVTYVEKPSGGAFTSILISLLPVILIIAVLYFLFTRQLKMAGKGAMSFGKSRAKMLTRDKDRVLFKDVAGCDEAKEEVSEIIDFLKDPKKFQKIGGRVPKGILMVGPPGTGKTLLAKAVAGEADVPFFSISGSDFVEMFVGVGAARVRDMFEQGRKSAPCIIFVDEIDAVGRQRGAGLGGGNDEREQTLNSLLVEMDGFDGHEGIIIIAATNRPDVLDSALLRPGRFDRQVMIDLPDLKGREEILKVHAKKIKMVRDIDLAAIARSTPGFSGADLANLLNEGALIAARYNKSEVTMADIEEARDKISFGRERRRLMDDEDKRMTAYHEAGHALVQAVIDDKKMRLHKVTIIPRGGALGMTMFTPAKDILGYSKKELLNKICMAMGGRIGEEVETGDFSNGASGDIKQATRIARHMVCDWGMSDLGPVALGENQQQIFLAKEITRSQNYSEQTARKIDEAITAIIDTEYKRAQEIILAHKDALDKISEALLKYETIEGKHVYEILEHGEIRSEVINNTPELKAENAARAKAEAEAAAQKASDKPEGEVGGSAPANAPA